MYYYKRNLGDYAKKAGRLSMLQHGAYTLLIDSCYDREQFPTRDEAIDWTWASSTAEIEAVDFVLSKFFTLVDGVYMQHRIQEELDAFHATSETNKRIASEREAKRKEALTKRERSVNEPPPNQEPLTNNQEPKNTKSSADLLSESAPVAEPSAFSIPLNDSTEYQVPMKSIREWTLAFPAVNVEQELREMRVWSMANKANRKTARGVDAFIVRWLAKAQDTPGRTRNGGGGHSTATADDWTRQAV